MRFTAVTLAVTVLLGACSAAASLSDAQKVWCVDHTQNSANLPDGNAVDDAALSMGLIAGAKTDADTAAYWQARGFGPVGVARVDEPFRSDPVYIKACLAAYDAAH